jgi:hypothetical protein|nr:MAG TPA: hypothetical protein [Caudoviricetes sp.]
MKKHNMNYHALKCVYDLLELICDIAVDYDGFNTVESLKELVDEMAGYAPARRGNFWQVFARGIHQGKVQINDNPNQRVRYCRKVACEN